GHQSDCITCVPLQYSLTDAHQLSRTHGRTRSLANAGRPLHRTRAEGPGHSLRPLDESRRRRTADQRSASARRVVAHARSVVTLTATDVGSVMERIDALRELYADLEND